MCEACPDERKMASYLGSFLCCRLVVLSSSPLVILLNLDVFFRFQTCKLPNLQSFKFQVSSFKFKVAS